MSKINMAENIRESKAPYIAKSWMNNFFQLIGKVRLTEVTGKVIQQYSLTSPGNEYKLKAALKFLKIIDDDEQVNSELMKNLRMQGDIFNDTVAKILKDSYPEIFETWDLEKATSLDLKNYFIGKYDYSLHQATGAIRLFVFLCDVGKISLSEELSVINKQMVQDGIPKKRKTASRDDKSIPKKDRKKEEPSGILVKCNINESFEPKTKKELDAILKGNVFQALRLLLPDQVEDSQS